MKVTNDMIKEICRFCACKLALWLFSKANVTTEFGAELGSLSFTEFIVAQHERNFWIQTARQKRLKGY